MGGKAWRLTAGFRTPHPLDDVMLVPRERAEWVMATLNGH